MLKIGPIKAMKTIRTRRNQTDRVQFAQLVLNGAKSEMGQNPHLPDIILPAGCREEQPKEPCSHHRKQNLEGRFFVYWQETIVILTA